MMLKSITSSRDFSGNRHTYARARQLRADLESPARGYLIWPDTSLLTRQRCARVGATNTGAVSYALTAAGVHQPNHLDRLPRWGSRTPSAVKPRTRRSTSTATFKTETITKSQPKRRSMPAQLNHILPKANADISICLDITSPRFEEKGQ